MKWHKLCWAVFQNLRARLSEVGASSLQALATSSASFADSLYGLRRVPVDPPADSGAGTSGSGDGAAGSSSAPARALSRPQQRWTLLLLVHLRLLCTWP